MVVQTSKSLQFSSHSTTDSPKSIRDRCFSAGMGCSLPGKKNRGTMVTRGNLSSHQLSGAVSSLPGTKNICERVSRCYSTPEDGQCNSSNISEQDGRNSFATPLHSSSNPVGLVPREKHLGQGRAPARNPKYSCRHRVQSDERQMRLETGPSGLQADSKSDRSTGGGPLCLTLNSSTPSVLQLETRPRSRSSGCIHSELVQHTGLC